MPYDTFASELPYPDIECAENIADAKLLMPLYGGPAGELTAITTYCFQSYVTTRNKEIAAAVGGIAKTEMHHHALLGHAIVGLGGYPVMGGRTYWSGSFPNYTLFVIDGSQAPAEAPLKGVYPPQRGLTLPLAESGKHDRRTGVGGWHFAWGATGIVPVGGGYFYLSHNGAEPDTKRQYSRLVLYRWTGDAAQPFQSVP